MHAFSFQSSLRFSIFPMITLHSAAFLVLQRWLQLRSMLATSCDKHPEPNLQTSNSSLSQVVGSIRWITNRNKIVYSLMKKGKTWYPSNSKYLTTRLTNATALFDQVEPFLDYSQALSIHSINQSIAQSLKYGFQHQSYASFAGFKSSLWCHNVADCYFAWCAKVVC